MTNPPPNHPLLLCCVTTTPASVLLTYGTEITILPLPTKRTHGGLTKLPLISCPQPPYRT